MMASQLFGFVLSYICLGLAVASPDAGIVMLAVCSMTAAVLTLFLKEDLRRTNRNKQDPLLSGTNIKFEVEDMDKPEAQIPVQPVITEQQAYDPDSMFHMARTVDIIRMSNPRVSRPLTRNSSYDTRDGARSTLKYSSEKSQR